MNNAIKHIILTLLILYSYEIFSGSKDNAGDITKTRAFCVNLSNKIKPLTQEEAENIVFNELRKIDISKESRKFGYFIHKYKVILGKEGLEYLKSLNLTNDNPFIQEGIQAISDRLKILLLIKDFKAKGEKEKLLKKTLLGEKCDGIALWEAYEKKEDEYKKQFFIQKFKIQPTSNKKDILYIQYTKDKIFNIECFQISLCETTEKPIFQYFCKKTKNQENTKNP